MASLGIGLVGLGRHGMRYARHLLEPIPGARLVAVSRRRVEQGKAFAAQQAVRFYQDYRDLIADPAVQAIAVVTPPSLSRSICLEAVRAGKPLLIEKPLARTGPEALEMVRAAESARIPLMTAQTLRFDSAVLALKAELQAVGPRRYLVLTNRVEPRPGGGHDLDDYGGRGVLLEIGVHLLDLVRFLTGEEVAEVRCEMDEIGSGCPESRAVSTLRTTGGFSCLVDVSRVSAGRVSRAEWVGRDGQMAADWARHCLVTVSSQQGAKERLVPDRPTVVAALQAFVEAVTSGRPMPISGIDGQRAVEIADACYESAKNGRPVKLSGTDG